MVDRVTRFQIVWIVEIREVRLIEKVVSRIYQERGIMYAAPLEVKTHACGLALLIIGMRHGPRAFCNVSNPAQGAVVAKATRTRDRGAYRSA